MTTTPTFRREVGEFSIENPDMTQQQVADHFNITLGCAGKYIRQHKAKQDEKNGVIREAMRKMKIDVVGDIFSRPKHEVDNEPVLVKDLIAETGYSEKMISNAVKTLRSRRDLHIEVHHTSQGEKAYINYGRIKQHHEKFQDAFRLMNARGI